VKCVDSRQAIKQSVEAQHKRTERIYINGDMKKVSNCLRSVNS
jgi:hypothetical protein